jgi:hypothetical protein
MVNAPPISETWQEALALFSVVWIAFGARGDFQRLAIRLRTTLVELTSIAAS